MKQNPREWLEERLAEAEEYQMQGKVKPAFLCYEEIEQWFEATPPSEVWEEGVAQMFYAKAMLHSEQNDIDHEVATYQKLVHRFGHSETLAVQQLVAEALINLSYTLHENGRITEAIGCFDTIATLYGHSPDTVLQQYVEKAADIKAEWEAEKAQ